MYLGMVEELKTISGFYFRELLRTDFHPNFYKGMHTCQASPSADNALFNYQRIWLENLLHFFFHMLLVSV